MSLKFNIDRPKASDEEIDKQKNFKELVDRFKQQSLKKAQGDESWWKNKKISYSAVIAGITVVCTITYAALKTKNTNTKHETLTTHQISKNTSGKPAFVSAPSQKLAIRYSSYKVNNTQGANIVHNKNTKITVPKNSFVDKNGHDIIGEVTIAYREFHDIGDIVVSGIPMAYDSAGKKFNLESAGMFEITGTQNGEPVFIKDQQNIAVELASQNAEDRFNQYYLDTIAQNWTYLKRDHCSKAVSPTPPNAKVRPDKNTSKLVALQQEVNVIIPKKIDSIKVVYENKISRIPVPKEPLKPAQANKNRASFKLDGSTDEFPELAAFNNVLFEVGPENKNYRKEMHEITWSDVKVSPGPDRGKNYLLTLSYRSRSEKLIVYPVLQGSDYEKALEIYDQKLANYDALVEKRQKEEKRLVAEMEAKQRIYVAEQRKKEEELEKEKAKLLLNEDRIAKADLSANFNSLDNKTRATRLFSVSKFGIYNSDCPQPDIGTVPVVPVFTATNEKIILADAVYLVDHNRKTVYQISRENSYRFAYSPNNTYSICIFTKNKLYLCKKEAFKETVDQGSTRFIVTTLPDGADNLPDFKKALEI